MTEIRGQKSETSKATALCTMVFALCSLLLAPCSSSQAQQSKTVPRIGYLSGGGSSLPQEFVQALRDLGYNEGKNIVFEYRTRGNTGRYPDLIADLVRVNVDVIVADGTGPALAAKQATSTIPIVMTSSTDPVRTGLVASLARPGGNVTGLTSVSGELGGKLLELLKEIVPALSRVVVPGPAPGSPSEDLFIKETEIPARTLKVRLIRVPVRRDEDIEKIFQLAAKERAHALLVRIPPNAPAARRRQFVELAAKNRLPAIYQAQTWMDLGGLMSYGSDRNVAFQRVAVYVDKILKGTKPADLPVEAPKDFDLVINLKAAKQIGLTIPPNVLARADRVIR
jgi:putative tryptophan/tyrosine transport system substrate-binding protein